MCSQCDLIQQNLDMMEACTILVSFIGARALEVDFLHHDVPIHEAAWWATATFQGTKVTTENHESPGLACDALAGLLLNGARCFCGRAATTDPEGQVLIVEGKLSDGAPTFTEEEVKKVGVCKWQRFTSVWVPACMTRDGVIAHHG